MDTKTLIKKALIKYFEGFADRVANDTLSFKEGLTIFLLGGLVFYLLKILSWILS